MSGAPVVLTDGTIVGVLSGSFDEGRGIAWAIPSKYVSDLLKTPAIMQLPSTSFHWPSFALMSTSWVSLGRSYSKSFDASHLAQLESLEGLLRSIRGRWRGTADFRRTVFSDARHPLNPLGSCYAIGTVFTELEFVDVTVDTPHLLARHRVSQTVTDLQYEFGLEVKYGVAGTAESKAEARRKLFKGCGADESGRSQQRR